MPNFNRHTLADALTAIETHDGLTPNQRRDMASAINRVATYLNRSPADLRIDPPALRLALAKIHPVQVGISAKSLANVKSALSNALQTVGYLPSKEPKVEPSVAWQNFLSNCSAPHQGHALSRLITYCSNRDIEPTDLTDAVMMDFQSHLDGRLLAKDPAKLCKELAQSWNGIVKRNNLPLAQLSYEKGKQHRCLPLTAYPESLQKEIEGYLGKLAHDDIFDEDGPDKPLKPLSLRNTKAHLTQFLDGLASAGTAPDEFTCLAHVVTAAKMKIAFRAIRDRSGHNSIPKGLYNIAATLMAVARHHLKAAPEDLEAIAKIKRKVAPTETGMSDKNRERLIQFNDWENIVALLTLPEALAERAKEKPPSRSSALLAMHAAAISILLSCPVRAKNLASLDLDRNLIPHRKGTQTSYTIRIDGDEVKNGEPIEARLNARHSKVLYSYITKFRPLVSDVPGTALFPKQSDGKPRDPANFGSDLKALIFRGTGLTVHAHLFRHITAKLYLREAPGSFEAVRQMLRHRKLQTTMDYYAEFSNHWSHEHYDEKVLSKWGGSHD